MHRRRNKQGKYPESFNERASNTLNKTCWKLEITNYKEIKTVRDFYTGDKRYAKVKKGILLKVYPTADIKIVQGEIKFIKHK